MNSDLESFLKSTGTTAFIVIKDDTILYENYFNGYKRDSINRSFSVSKSFVSALIGIAIDDGYIKDVSEPFTLYIPELRGKGFDGITIKHLLMMTSGLKFRNGILPWDDLAILYFTPDLRRYVLSHLSKEELPAEHFLYNSYNTLLLGIILERSTHRTVSQYLEEKIWKPLGMEYPALWSINSEQDGLESCPSGLNARAIDFAKFGRLFLAQGKWNGKQIISESWIRDSVTPPDSVPNGYYPQSVKDQHVDYKYQWWGHSVGPDHYNYFASGQLGQLIYLDPAKKLIIVRFGKKTGNLDHGWYEIAQRISDTIE
jgi:CubicO group peptidase (beta-lactamase class C family)